MKRHGLVTAVLILASVLVNGPVWADSEEAPRPRGQTVGDEPSPDPRQAAAELLNGREVVLRLYTAWKIDPKAYTTLKVPLEGLDVTCDAVRQACGASKLDPAQPPDAPPVQLDDETWRVLDQELNDAAMVVVPGEQQDNAIATVLRECLWGNPYRKGQRFTLWPGDIPWVQQYPCLFVDVLQQPIPNAEVEILLANEPYHRSAYWKVWIGNAELDSNGRMPSPQSSSFSTLRCLLFTVIHPDCGPVSAEWTSRVPEPGAAVLFRVGALPRDKKLSQNSLSR